MLFWVSCTMAEATVFLHIEGMFMFLFCGLWLNPATPWTAARQDSLSFTISQSLLKLMLIELVMPSNHLILCCPLLPPSIFPSIRVFSSESALRIRWPKDWSFSLNISPSNEYSGLISFRMDWLDFLAVQGTGHLVCLNEQLLASHPDTGIRSQEDSRAMAGADGL